MVLPQPPQPHPSPLPATDSPAEGLSGPRRRTALERLTACGLLLMAALCATAATTALPARLHAAPSRTATGRALSAAALGSYPRATPAVHGDAVAPQASGPRRPPASAVQRRPTGRTSVAGAGRVTTPALWLLLGGLAAVVARKWVHRRARGRASLLSPRETYAAFVHEPQWALLSSIGDGGAAAAQTGTALTEPDLGLDKGFALLEHINVNVPEQEPAKSFYFGVLGCAVDRRRQANVEYVRGRSVRPYSCVEACAPVRRVSGRFLNVEIKAGWRLSDTELILSAATRDSTTMWHELLAV